MQRQFNRNLKRFGVKLFGNKSVGVFSAEYQAVYDAFTIKPSAAIATAQNTMVKTLVDGGVWVKGDVFGMLAGHTNANGESLINWFNPGTFNATAVNAPTFVSLEGFTSNGTTSYINSNWKAFTNGIKYTQNEASFAVYTRTVPSDALKVLGGSVKTSPNSFIQILPKFTGDYVTSINSTDNIATPNATPEAGMYGTIRDSATNIRSYMNSSKEQDAVSASTVMNDLEVFLGARNLDGSPAIFTNYQISMYWLGGKLTEAEYLILLNAFEAYMDSNGKGVIP